jgi:sortase A
VFEGPLGLQKDAWTGRRGVRVGTRSNKRKFRRRRQRAGFVLLASLIIMFLSGVLFFRTEPLWETNSAPVGRVEAPAVFEAPEAIAEGATEDVAGEKVAPSEEEQKKEGPKTPAEDKPAIPTPATNDMWLTIPKLGLYDNYVANSDDPAALDQGAAKRVSTKFPWQEDANTYIAAHRLGWPGTASDHQFYNLPNLVYGDKVYLYDSNGTTYTYEVTEIIEVLPSETWVTKAEPGRDMISLQTCIENYGDYWTMGPNWYVRYVVRADRVGVTPA